MRRRPFVTALALAASVWAGAASACLPPPQAVPPAREAGESDDAYQARVARLRAEALASEQRAYASWARHREESLWASTRITRIAVVDVARIDAPDNPPSMTIGFVFTTVAPERGMQRGEQFTLTENRFSPLPCVPAAHYGMGQRYILFTNDEPISSAATISLLLPAEEVRSEHGLALLRAAERAAP